MCEFPIGVLQHVDAFGHGKNGFNIGIGENEGHCCLAVFP
jgi:hypothetical protein